MQSALRLLYPPQCLTCSTLVDSAFGLCGPCWRETRFIYGLACSKCGAPLPGEDDDENVLCDDCIQIARPWSRGRAAMVYTGNARKLVLSLKHGDRTELARPATEWMLRVAGPVLQPDMLVAPVPLHWTRLLRRRYNQAALLAKGVANKAEKTFCPDLLVRRSRTQSLDGLSRDARFAQLSGKITLHPARRHLVAGRSVLVVDDVMTSGATLGASAEACLSGGAAEVNILVLARVAKDD
ncbi:MAG: ComF family protein [Halocynthiibacter sp.]